MIHFKLGTQSRRVARLLFPFWRQWILVLGCVGAAVGIGLIPPLCIRAILDRAIPQRNTPLLILLSGAMIGLSVLGGLVGIFQDYLNLKVGQSMVADLRNTLFQRLQQMSLPFYSQTRAGEIVSRLNNDVAAIQNVATNTFVQIVSNSLTIAATFCVIFALSWRIALLTLVAFPLLLVPTRLVGRVRHRLSRQTQESQADSMAFLQERLSIGGMLITKIFGKAPVESEQFARHNRRVMELTIQQSLSGRWLTLGITVGASAIPAFVYWYGGALAIRGELTTGTIIAFITYLTNLYRPVFSLSNVYLDVQGALAVFERIFEFLDLRPEVEDSPRAATLGEVKGHLRFENVSFAYPTVAHLSVAQTTPSAGESDPQQSLESQPLESQPFALRNVTFEMRPGERVALVGPSGAGKTTVTYLLPRFLDPQSGLVSLDGHDLRDLTQESLRENIGMVTQETFLFHGTVRDNLLYARPEATHQEIEAAAQAAHIHDLIQSLPQKYDTVVGERAFRLSGGEKQRLSIARALLKNPQILILDEATSSLDATSEHLIQEALEKLLQGRTSLIIAHRLSTILSADKILVLDQGRLVESGTHAQLLENNGLYATLYHQQLSRVVSQNPH